MKKSKKELEKDYLTINKMYRDLKWLLYDDVYKCKELQEAHKVLGKFREQIKEQIEDS